MPVTSITKNVDDLTMTIIADFPVPLRRLWDAYVDPRLIEQFWGPPEWPARFTRHDAYAGGWSAFAMVGPDGEVNPGYWHWLEIDELQGFTVIDGFAHSDGTPNDDMPSMRMVFAFEQTETGSRVTTTTYFDSADELETLLGMGMDEGMKAAMGQMDAVLADLAAFAAGDGTVTQLLSGTTARVSRVVRGSIQEVWRAHHESSLIRQWMLGPDGWTMPVCEPGRAAGDTYRYEWEDLDGENRFGFTGTVRESEAPHREVSVETMIDTEGPSVVNELTLSPVEGGTLLSVVMIFADAKARDEALATGMADGMETSYARLEKLLAT